MHHHGIDYTAIATVALVVVTAVYVWLTGRTLRFARLAAEAAEVSAREMRLAREAEFAPIIIGRTSPFDRNPVPSHWFENVGKFVAQHVFLFLGALPVGSSTLWIDSATPPHLRDVVQPGLPWAIAFDEVKSFRASHPQLFADPRTLTLAEFLYTDLFGNWYRSLIVLDTNNPPYVLYWGRITVPPDRKFGVERRTSAAEWPGTVETTLPLT
jgi:hypothetical protein